MENLFKSVMPNQKVKIIGAGEKYCDEILEEFKKCRLNFEKDQNRFFLCDFLNDMQFNCYFKSQEEFYL